jgi:hypothetical protein
MSESREVWLDADFPKANFIETDGYPARSSPVHSAVHIRLHPKRSLGQYAGLVSALLGSTGNLSARKRRSPRGFSGTTQPSRD